MALPETVQEYSTYAAEAFIQTAVFVDDRIYERSFVNTEEPTKITAPKSRKKAIKTVASEIDSKVVASTLVMEEDSSPDTYDIVNSFAKKQIVCSLYQPKKTAKVSPTSDIFPLCRAADVVIVDWDLFGDKGIRALELIHGLITQAVHDVPEQLRLILVYTQEANLFGIANEIYEIVSADIGEILQLPPDENGLAFHTANSRIAVLGKPGRERADIPPQYVINEKDLADVAVRQFAKLASGILHAATLLGLAEIRKNSRKILSRFGSELDPAFLTHLAMSLPEEDASSHITPLLVSEIEAVLEDALPNPLIPKKLLEDWCMHVWKPGDHLNALFASKGLDHRRIAVDICTKGFKIAKDTHNAIPNLSNGAQKVRKAAKILIPSDNSDINHRFSHLMASRTFYGDKQKELKLGSILHNKSNDQYLLCIQPICDSVRLKSRRAFIFVEMSIGDSPGHNLSHVVFKNDKSMLELIYQPKSYLCCVANFLPDSTSQRVIAKKNQDNELYFEDINGIQYLWIDQLRTSHAQRAVERFASELSRVGLTESEWLRLLGSK